MVHAIPHKLAPILLRGVVVFAFRQISLRFRSVLKNVKNGTDTARNSDAQIEGSMMVSRSGTNETSAPCPRRVVER
jgi:hypothetical protein